MEFDAFFKQCKKDIVKFITSLNYDLNDENSFRSIDEPYKLGEDNYKIYNHRILHGLLPDKNNNDIPLKYIFFILETDNKFKEKYRELSQEIGNNSASNEETKKYVYEKTENFVPGNIYLKELNNCLETMLVQTYFPNKGYKFVFSDAILSLKADFALIFLEINSFIKLKNAFDNDLIHYNPEMR